MGNIIAGIVLYNPEIERFKKNIDSIARQVKKLIIVDNNSSNITEINEILKEYKNMKIIYNKSNLGIARALNQMCESAYIDNYDWILTLDQDSICPDNIINEFKERTDIQGIGIICPLINDLNNPSRFNTKTDDKLVDKCITSGSMVKLEAWKKINGFDDRMFIDLVDFDFSKRLRKEKYSILQVCEVLLSHEIGNIEKHKFFNREINVMNHSAFRKYYMARNNLYYAKKHYPEESYTRAIAKNLKLLALVILYESKKPKKIKNILKGTIDGFFLRV